MRKYKILLLFQLFSVLIYAQDRTITGTITSTDGGPLPGATVLEKGTGNGTSSDFDGKYQITVPQSGDVILEISFVGFEDQNITVGSSNTIDVVLIEAANALEEVVVTALGIERESKSLVYSRQAVNTEGLEEARSTNLLNSLSGNPPIRVKSNGYQVIEINNQQDGLCIRAPALAGNGCPKDTIPSTLKGEDRVTLTSHGII